MMTRVDAGGLAGKRRAQIVKVAGGHLVSRDSDADLAHRCHNISGSCTRVVFPDHITILSTEMDGHTP
jgi:hypothetical protein